MSAEPLVTIMIPTYNQASFLGKAVDSALAQDYERLEIVVADDNSTDDTATLMQKYAGDPRVSYSRNEVNLGRVRNYKHLLEDLARGEWVINLDGDDFFTDVHFISEAMSHIKAYENVVFVQGGHEVKNAEGKLLDVALPSITNDVTIMPGTEYFLGFHHFSHMATLYKRQAAIAIDFYRYDILSTDIESFLRLALHGNVILLKRIAGVWLHHGTNTSQRLSVDLVEKNMLRITGPAEHAAATRSLPQQAIRKWQQHKLYGYILHYLTVYFSNKKLIPGYLLHVLRKYRSPYVLKAVPIAFLKGIKNKYSRVAKRKN